MNLNMAGLLALTLIMRACYAERGFHDFKTKMAEELLIGLNFGQGKNCGLLSSQGNFSAVL